MKNANEALITYVKSLTDEQAEKLVERLDVLKRLAGMSKNELIFTDTFLERLFGKE